MGSSGSTHISRVQYCRRRKTSLTVKPINDLEPLALSLLNPLLLECIFSVDKLASPLFDAFGLPVLIEFLVDVRLGDFQVDLDAILYDECQ